jgi:hypothetical protein
MVTAAVGTLISSAQLADAGESGGGFATQVNAEPEVATNPAGTQHIFGVFAGDASNQPTTATPIRADILPGSPHSVPQAAAEITCQIDPNPQTDRGTFPAGQVETHECSYPGNGTGTDTLRVFADTNNNAIFDQGEPFDDIVKTWSGPPTALQLSDGDVAPAGSCNEFTARVTDQQGNPVRGRLVDVRQTLKDAGTEPSETRELAFCNPRNALGPNPTGQGTTAFSDVQGNNQDQVAGKAGRNITVHGEVGPTNANGEVTFGITINHSPVTATVSVRAWIDKNGDNDVLDDGEPTDAPSTKTWTPGHRRRITINFEHGAADTLIVFGRVTVPDGFSDCAWGTLVKIQRRRAGKWTTRENVATDQTGRYEAMLVERQSLYRAVALHDKLL